MLSRFSVYDFIAVVVPGLFFLWILGAVLGIESLRSALPLTGGLTDASVLVAVSYVVGLLLQGISQHFVEHLLVWWWGGFPSARWLLPDDDRFTVDFKRELTDSLKGRFGIDLREEGTRRRTRAEALRRNQEIFYRCYRSVERESDLPQTFVAQYGLFRALFTTFALLALVVISLIVTESYRGGGVTGDRHLSLLACAVGATVTYWRVRKRGEDFAKAVYDVFLAHAGANHSAKGGRDR